MKDSKTQFKLYLAERFKPFQYLLFAAMLFISGHLLTKNNDSLFSNLLVIILGVLTLYLIFFRLRAFDDMKDKDIDDRIHPDRPVQRGVITLNTLAKLSLIALLIEFLMNLLLGIGALILYAGLMTFTLIMFKEFFLRKFLRRDIFLYAVTHVTALGLCGIYAAMLYPAVYHVPINVSVVILFGLISYLLGLLFEMTRKMPSKNEESDQVPTFTKRFGRKNVWIIVGGIIFIIGLLFLEILRMLNVTIIYSFPSLFMGLIVVFLALFQTTRLFRLKGKTTTMIGSAVISINLLMIIILGLLI